MYFFFNYFFSSGVRPISGGQLDKTGKGLLREKSNPVLFIPVLVNFPGTDGTKKNHPFRSGLSFLWRILFLHELDSVMFVNLFEFFETFLTEVTLSHKVID